MDFFSWFQMFADFLIKFRVIWGCLYPSDRNLGGNLMWIWRFDPTKA